MCVCLCLCLPVCSDVGVIYYHISVPPHPKFLLRLPRRMSIRDHTVSGVVEIVAGVCAFCWNDPTYPLYVQLVAAVFFHIPSDIYQVWARIFRLSPVRYVLPCVTSTLAFQTPNVFGVRIIMVPAYALVVALKLLCAINLWLDMYSMQKLLMLVIIHHIYVWCRVFMAIFTTARVMQAHEYTVSILLAGFICLPAVLGPTGNIMAMMVLVFYWGCHNIIRGRGAVGRRLSTPRTYQRDAVGPGWGGAVRSGARWGRLALAIVECRLSASRLLYITFMTTQVFYMLIMVPLCNYSVRVPPREPPTRLPRYPAAYASAAPRK